MIKVGDKIRILPCAVNIFVDHESIGNVCEVTHVGSFGANSISVKDGLHNWSLQRKDWEHYIKEEQLLFSFMKEV